MDTSGFSAKEQQKASEIQMEELLTSVTSAYNFMTRTCFNNCVNDMSSSALTRKEETCLRSCGEKFTKYQQRFELRFNEEGSKIQRK
ncbi:uncharacterized protein V1516DRAFT_669640 [Lipomyces oligophaga]|uniref:uncharacterized protein n=1 Tax=Lipomyces oligophaga TaxID=45792 RepID=UPI0034D000E9